MRRGKEDLRYTNEDLGRAEGDLPSTEVDLHRAEEDLRNIAGDLSDAKGSFSRGESGLFQAALKVRPRNYFQGRITGCFRGAGAKRANGSGRLLSL